MECHVKGPDVAGPEFHIGIDVQPGETHSRLVADQEGLTLGGHGDGYHTDHRPVVCCYLSRIIGAAVGYHDYVEFARASAGNELSEQAPDDRASLCAGMMTVTTWPVWTVHDRGGARIRCASRDGARADSCAALGTSKGERRIIVDAPQVEQTADVDSRAVLGPGTTVWHLAQIRENARLGSGCIVGRGAYVGPGVLIGDNVKLQNYALVYEPARLEDGVFIGPAAVLTNDLYPRSVDRDRKAQAGRGLGRQRRGGPGRGIAGRACGGRARSRNRVLGDGCGRRGSDP